MTYQKKLNVEEFLAERREAGKRIDPETAEIFSQYVDLSNEYYVLPLDENRCVGRQWYAYTPEDGTVSFSDIPEEKCKRLHERFNEERARRLKARYSNLDLPQEKKLMVEQFIAGRREAGKRIDPETAEVARHAWVDLEDPYRIISPSKFKYTGGHTFAYSPEEGLISFDDLPEKTRTRLYERLENGMVVIHRE